MFPFVVLPTAAFVGCAIGHLAKKMRSDRKVKETQAIYFTDMQQWERALKKLTFNQTQERHKREEQMLHRSFHLVCDQTELF